METKTFFSSVLRSAALALLFSLSGILIFALVVKFAVLDQTVIKIVNQFIKVIAVFIGCFFSVKGKMGIIKGAIAGAVSTFLLYAIFALMSGTELFGIEMLIDILFTAFIGGISGIIAVNVRGKE